MPVALLFMKRVCRRAGLGSRPAQAQRSAPNTWLIDHVERVPQGVAEARDAAVRDLGHRHLYADAVVGGNPMPQIVDEVHRPGWLTGRRHHQLHGTVRGPERDSEVTVPPGL